MSTSCIFDMLLVGRFHEPDSVVSLGGTQIVREPDNHYAGCINVGK